MKKIDATVLGNLFINELMKSYPEVATHLEEYILLSTARDGSSDYDLIFVEHTHILSEEDKQGISDIFNMVKEQLM
jgi:hypothetical protein